MENIWILKFLGTILVGALVCMGITWMLERAFYNIAGWIKKNYKKQ